MFSANNLTGIDNQLAEKWTSPLCGMNGYEKWNTGQLELGINASAGGLPP